MSVGRREKKTPVVSRGAFLLLAGFVLLLDQFTKASAKSFLLPGASRTILPNLFRLTLVENQGIAFGFFQGGEKLLLAVISMSICVLIAVGFYSHPERIRVQWGIGLILGGALGNWVDRVRLGAVIDFLDFHLGRLFNWPVFNFADTAISVGVGLFLLDWMKKNAS